MRGGALKTADEIKSSSSSQHQQYQQQSAQQQQQRSRQLLQPHTKWAHITCALCLPSVSFGVASTRSCVQVASSALATQRRHAYECAYCSLTSSSTTSPPASTAQQQQQQPRGLTVKCHVGACARRFHVTCALMNGECLFVQLTDASASTSVQVFCGEHAAAQRRKMANAQARCTSTSIRTDACRPNHTSGAYEIGTVLTLQSAVVFKTPRRRQRKGGGGGGGGEEVPSPSPLTCVARVTHVLPSVFYEVDFGDGTFSNDMLPTDVVGTCLKCENAFVFFFVYLVICLES